MNTLEKLLPILLMFLFYLLMTFLNPTALSAHLVRFLTRPGLHT
jgi:hypothetical protein